MSKRKRGKSVLVNTTKNKQYRNVLVEPDNYNNLCVTLSKIVDNANCVIQKLNIAISNRQIPYVKGICIQNNLNQNPTDNRIVLWGKDTSLTPHKCVSENREGSSHLIEFQLSTSYSNITFSNSECDAKLVIDDEYLEAATTDMFLDIVMFNSYSFLRNMALIDKKKFSRQKFEYFKKNSLESFYEYDEADTLLYYSLAFSARKDKDNIDIEKYICLWNDFLNAYYPGKYHIEESIEEQLKKHTQYGQLKHKSIISRISHRPMGAYFLVKVCKVPRKSDNVKRMYAIFGQKQLSCKLWKIIPVEKYPELDYLAQRGYISVFKLVRS